MKESQKIIKEGCKENASNPHNSLCTTFNESSVSPAEKTSFLFRLFLLTTEDFQLNCLYSDQRHSLMYDGPYAKQLFFIKISDVKQKRVSIYDSHLLSKTSQELRMLSRSLSVYQCLLVSTSVYQCLLVSTNLNLNRCLCSHCSQYLLVSTNLNLNLNHCLLTTETF